VTIEAAVNTLNAGDQVANVLVGTAQSRRLSTVARAFEKYRFTSLKFRVACKGPSTVSGGFVAAYIPDPQEEVKDFQQVLSYQGAVSGKWWETVTITAHCPPAYLFVARGVEPRLRFPGRFVMFSDGAPSSSAVPITVDMIWAVQLSDPGFENPEEELTTIVAQTDIFPVNGHNMLVPKWEEPVSDSDCNACFGNNAWSVARLRFPISTYTGTNEYVENAWFIQNQGGVLRMFNDAAGQNPCVWNGKIAQVLIPEGVILDIVKDRSPKPFLGPQPPAIHSRGAAGPTSGTAQSALTESSLEDFLDRFETSLQQLGNLLRSLKRSPRTSTSFEEVDEESTDDS